MYYKQEVQVQKKQKLNCATILFTGKANGSLPLFQARTKQSLFKSLKVMGYHEGAWFKNNFAKVLSACNYYAGIAPTSNAVSFRSLRNKSVLQQSVWSYLTRAQRYSRHTVQIFAVSLFKVVCICKTCYSSILTTQILPRD